MVIENVFPESELNEIKHRLSNETYYGEGSYKNTKLDREQKWYHQEGKPFCSLWTQQHHRWNGHLYDSQLLSFQNKILSTAQHYLLQYNINLNLSNHNSCLINKYNGGNQFIRPHRDSPLSFGDLPTIIGFSVGATRDFVMESNKNEKMNYELKDNSIFIMAGRSQIDWTHSIPAKPEESGVRYSMTIRHHIL